MNKKLLQKPSSTRGETLAEALCGILVTALSAALLATAVSVSAKLNGKAKEKTDEMYSALTNAELATGDSSEGTIEITIGGKENSFNVKFYGKNGTLISYRGTQP